MNRDTVKALLAAGVAAVTVSASNMALATPFNLTRAATKDSFLRSSRSNTNEGANEILAVQRTGHNRAVVGFDLTGIDAAGVTSAQLVLTVKQNLGSWGRAGRTIDVYPLLADFDEGNGNTFMVSPSLFTRGTGSGVTWACASDASIANSQTDCSPVWNGGSFGPVTGSVVFLGSTTGQVTFDVTADVKASKSSWLVKRTDEVGTGGVDFYSREGAAAAGNADLAPKLVIAGCTANPEICNGLDDDCNGQIDDGIPPEITTCGVGACAATGSTSCVNGQTVVTPCTPGTPSTEVCDGVDNDCNGQVDDGDVCHGCPFIAPDCNGVIPGGIPRGCPCVLNCANCIDSVCNLDAGGFCQ